MTNHPGPRRPALSPAMTTFVVVDVILVVTFLVLLVLLQPFRSGASPQAASTTPAPEATPDASVPAEPTDAAELEAFVLPSGNIWCEMTSTSATCTILQFTYTAPEAPDDCDGTVGNVLQVTAADGASMACQSGAPGPAPADAPVLEYGSASTVGEMTCHSSRNGATCRHNPTGAGFSVARGGYRFF